jgi:hypothetical protein
MVTYTVKPGHEEENTAVVRAVFEELAQTRPAGLRYAVFNRPDSRQLIHLYTDEGSASGVQGLAPFQPFVAGAEDRPSSSASVRSRGSSRARERAGAARRDGAHHRGARLSLGPRGRTPCASPRPSCSCPTLAGRSDAMLEVLSPSLAGNPGAAEFGARFERASASPGMFQNIFEMFLDVDVRDVLPVVHVPTLVLHRDGRPPATSHLHGSARTWVTAQSPGMGRHDHLADPSAARPSRSHRPCAGP